MSAVPEPRLAPKRQLLGESVSSAIRDLILHRRVEPGDRLTLVDLAEQMQTSITPVREALFQLSQDGWVLHEPHRGFRVAPLYRDDVIDTYRMWAVTEGDIAARAAERIDAAQIIEARAADERLRKLDDHTGHLALELNDDLHSVVHRASRASKLVWFADSVRRSVPLQFNQTFSVVPGWADFNRYGHTEIVDALEAHDVEASRSLMTDHFVTSGTLLVTHLDALRLWSDDEPPPA